MDLSIFALVSSRTIFTNSSMAVDFSVFHCYKYIQILTKVPSLSPLIIRFRFPYPPHYLNHHS
ncbi:MAG: hypothetical protein L0922_06345, partial [Candidatus Mariimomonas ferrooxydans]